MTHLGKRSLGPPGGVGGLTLSRASPDEEGDPSSTVGTRHRPLVTLGHGVRPMVSPSSRSESHALHSQTRALKEVGIPSSSFTLRHRK